MLANGLNGTLQRGVRGHRGDEHGDGLQGPRNVQAVMERIRPRELRDPHCRKYPRLGACDDIAVVMLLSLETS